MSADFLAAKRAKHEQRMAHRKATRTDRVRIEGRRRLAILERDGWVCHICTLPIDPTVQWPAVDSPTVDHVIPLAQGGSNDADNLAAAHAYCNNVKHSRLSA